jgi:glycosyltransferase involved in cell wall biosynthesis
MNVLLDARTVGRRFSGVGFYVLELVRALARLPDEHAYHLLIHGETVLDDLGLDARFRLHRTPFSPENHPFGDFWEDGALPRLARRLGADVLHGPAFLIPLRRTMVPKVVTIHDLVAFSHPETIPWKYAIYMRWLIRRAVREAQAVISVSQSVKDDIVRLLGAEPTRIVSIHHGVGEHFHPQSRERIDGVRARHGLEKPYLLFVGNLEPRKNLPLLVRAFRRVREHAPMPLDLVVAGQVAWKSGPLLEALGSHDVRDSVRLLGYVSSEELPALYSGAQAFVFPTLWEGFGLPVLEGMACGAPVVASPVESIVEIAGDAAIYVDPHDPESIAEGILHAVAPEQRDAIVARGLACAARYPWRETARRTLEVYATARTTSLAGGRP